MGCCESTEYDRSSRTPLKQDFDERKPDYKVSAAYENLNLRKDDSTRRQEVDEKGFWSDEEWSDEEENEKKKAENTERKKVRNKKLAVLEKQMFPHILISLQNYDANLLRTMQTSNIEPSVRLYEPIYKCKKHIMAQYLKGISEKGGKVLFVPPEDFEKWHFGIKANDQLFPVDVDGLGLSQILYLTLKGIKRTLGVNKGINLPHGAIRGYDIPEPEEQDSKKFTMFNSNDSWNTAFRVALGQPKSRRFGEKDGKKFHAKDQNNKWKMNEDFAQEMREYFDLFYYKQTPQNPADQEDPSSQKRVIFFCFHESGPLVLKRLWEVNKENTSLANVIVIFLPFADETRLSSNSPDFKQLNVSPGQYATLKTVEYYRLFARLFVPVLK